MVFCVLDVKGVIQLVQGNNSPYDDDDDKQSDTETALSLATRFAPSDTLKDFVRTLPDGFEVLQAVQLGQSLIKIIKRVHEKGVLHQNLGPESVLIRWDSKKNFADEAELVLWNFSHAHIISEKNSRINQSSSECWYKAPQADVESYKYTSTIDASGICAILFWLLTDIHPQHDRNAPSHQLDNVIEELSNKITHAVKSASTYELLFIW